MVVRRRLLFWLIKAYLKRWGKVIFAFFIGGLIIFFAFLKFLDFLLPKVHLGKTDSIGIVGAYEVSGLPQVVLSDISIGLTQISDKGEIIPGIAKSWQVEDGGKSYIFLLKDDQYFTNGVKITPDKVQYPFANVAVSRPDRSTIIYTLKDPYVPFLITTSRPLLQKGFVGVGPYKIKDVKLNGDFVQSITLSSLKNPSLTKKYSFYPTDEALKIGYMMGEINKATGVVNPLFENKNMGTFSNTKVSKNTNHSTLVTLFYNTQDPLLSDKKIRNSLSYALPDEFSQGEKAESLYPPFFWSYSPDYEKPQDFPRAKELLGESSATSSASVSIELKTLKKYVPVAKDIKKTWDLLGIKTKIVEVDEVPDTFQIFLGNFQVPKDPDQYSLWHSNEPNNISRYKNLRIDKYLEDGRKTVNQEERKQLYLDFQKYLHDDSPASFLYFPYEYTIERK